MYEDIYHALILSLHYSGSDWNINDGIIYCLFCRPSVMPEDSENVCKDLIKKKFDLWLHSKVDGSN